MWISGESIASAKTTTRDTTTRVDTRRSLMVLSSFFSSIGPELTRRQGTRTGGGARPRPEPAERPREAVSPHLPPPRRGAAIRVGEVAGCSGFGAPDFVPFGRRPHPETRGTLMSTAVECVRIDEGLIAATLTSRRRHDAVQVRDILTRALELKGLPEGDLAALMGVSDPELLGEVFQTARRVREHLRQPPRAVRAALHLQPLRQRVHVLRVSRPQPRARRGG